MKSKLPKMSSKMLLEIALRDGKVYWENGVMEQLHVQNNGEVVGIDTKTNAVNWTIPLAIHYHCTEVIQNNKIIKSNDKSDGIVSQIMSETDIEKCLKF